MNNVILIGRSTKDIESVQVGENLKAKFTLAVDKGYKNANGESQADFIEIEAWKGTAEILTKYAHKGSKLGIKGRISTNNYTKDDGTKVYKTFVVADQIELLDGKPSTESNTNTQNETGTPFTPDDDDLPF